MVYWFCLTSDFSLFLDQQTVVAAGNKKLSPAAASLPPFFMYHTVKSLTPVFRQIKNISLTSSRCLFSLHTRLGWSQRRQCETLQDPQAWQRGILYHYASTVWHITEACQTLYRYSLWCAKLPAYSVFLTPLVHYSSQSFITPWGLILKIVPVTPGARCHHAVCCAACNMPQSVTKGDE